MVNHSTTNPRRQTLTWVLSMLVIVGIFGWFTFRMTRRLAVEPYVDFQAFYLAAAGQNSGLGGGGGGGFSGGGGGGGGGGGW